MRASSKKFNKCQIIFVILKIFNLLPLLIFIIFRESLRPIRPSSSEDNLDIPVAYLVCGGSRPPSTVCRSPSSASSWSVTETEPYYHRPSLHSSCSINLSPHCTAQRARTSRFCTASSIQQHLHLSPSHSRPRAPPSQTEATSTRAPFQPVRRNRALSHFSLSVSLLAFSSLSSVLDLSQPRWVGGGLATTFKEPRRTDGRTGTKMRRAKRREVAGRKEGAGPRRW